MIFARLTGRRKEAPLVQVQPVGMPGFDADFYLAHNPDVAASGADPLAHYLEHGWREGREPSMGFNGQRYLALNPDVQAANVNPLVHYLDHGLAEGRVGAYAAPALAPTSQEPEAPPPPVEATQASAAPSADHHRHEPTRLL
ncbi:hypothetical protein [Methylobacterium sp. WL9]|uniref:hypothetical protein n=1 Tax=Methylobacterium sp. WL9 TaxID=2603898 RepID=UPI0016505A4D|nr:hypothetical protein [Methylobacterium sp. WL9]